MAQIDPAELSAYLDGELPAERAEEVRAALARDPELRRSYEMLVVHDADWRARAETAMFQPHVRFAYLVVSEQLFRHRKDPGVHRRRSRETPMIVIKIEIPSNLEQSVDKKKREGVYVPGMGPVQIDIIKKGRAVLLDYSHQTPVV